MEHLTLKAISWTVVVLIGCLGAPTPTLNRPTRLDISDFNIELMRKEVNCHTPDTKFYTPSTHDKCLLAAVQCVQAELKLVKMECEDFGDHVAMALESWDVVRKDLASSLLHFPNEETTAIMCQCELMPQADFHTFLNKTESLIQIINVFHQQIATQTQ